MATLVVAALGITAGLTLRADNDGPRTEFDLANADIAGPLGRTVGEPSGSRTLVDPSQPGQALAFANSDVATLAERIGRSTALDDAAQVRISDLRQSSTVSRDVCQGVPRPTASEDILITEAFRIVDADAVIDVRITEFDEPATVDRVLQASRSAWEACNGTPHEDSGTVERRVLPFVSLSGTAGVNLQSSLIDASGELESSSQTLAIPVGDVLIEVRLVSNGELSTSLDPVQVLDDVEALL